MKRVIFLMQDRIRWACPIGQLESMHQVMNSLELLKHEKSHHHLPPSWGLQWQEFQPTLGTGLSLLCVRHLVKMPMKKVSSSLLKQKKPGPRLKKKKKKKSYSKSLHCLSNNCSRPRESNPVNFPTFEPSKCPWETVPEHLYQSTPVPPYNKNHEPSLGW